MTVNFQAFLDAFKLYHFVILSTLAGYLLAAPASLRLWIATQRIPFLPLHKDEPITWKKKALAVGILTLLLAVEYALFFHASGQVLNGVLSAFFGYIFFGGTVALFSNVFGLMSWSVHRNIQGVPTVISIRQKRNKKQKAVLLSSLLAALTITACAFKHNQPALVAIISTAVIYQLSSRVGYKAISMRWMIICLLGWVAAALTGAAVAVFITLKWQSGSSDSDQESTPQADGLLAWSKEKSWLMTPLYAHIPGIFVALCLRFDYQRHLDSSATTAEFILSEVPAPEPKKGKKQQLGEGVVIPSHAPTAFPKVYYATALAAWGLTQLGLVCADAFTPLSLESGYEFSVLALIFELPVMCLALMAVAAVRGEWKVLWQYREVWVVKPEAKDLTSSETTPPIPVAEKTADVEHTAEL